MVGALNLSNLFSRNHPFPFCRLSSISFAGPIFLTQTTHTYNPDIIMSQIVPLISSGTAGPLGVLHLPRLWQKVSLEAAGKIADGYPGIGAGYDSMVIDGLGLDAEAVRSFISGSKPTYPQFEAWVKEQPGVKLDADSVGALNDSITGYNHDDATRQGILSANGLADGDPKDAINLNNLDDWLEFHAAEIA